MLIQGADWTELVRLRRQVHEVEWGECRELRGRLRATSDRTRSPESRAVLAILQGRLALAVCDFAFFAPSCVGTPASSLDSVPEEATEWIFDRVRLREVVGDAINIDRSVGEPFTSFKSFAPWLQRRLAILFRALDGGELEPAPLKTSVSAAGGAAALVGALRDDDIETRDRAEGALRLMGDEIIPFLLKELDRAEDPELRARLQELLDSM